MLRILLAVDSPGTRKDLRALLEREQFEVIEAPADGPEVARLTGARRPDIVVLSSLSSLAGTAAAAAIHEAQPQTPVILLIPAAIEAEIGAALAVGIRGCALDTDPAEGVVRAVYDVSRGGAYLSPAVLRVLFEPYLPAAQPPNGATGS